MRTFLKSLLPLLMFFSAVVFAGDSTPPTAKPGTASGAEVASAPAEKAPTYRVIFPSDTPDTGVNREIWIQFAGKTLPPDCTGMALFINDREGLWTKCYSLHDGLFRFMLSRNNDNLTGWREILGSPFNGDRQVPLKLVVTGKSGTYVYSVDGSVDPKNPQVLNANIEKYSLLGAATAGVLLLLFGAGLYYLVVETTACRDTGIPQMLWFERTYSLARCQMALWVFLTAAAFVFVYVMTGDWVYDTQSFALVGISAATGLGAIAIDATKTNQLETIQQNVATLGLKTQAQVEALCKIVTGRPLTVNNPVSVFACWTGKKIQAVSRAVGDDDSMVKIRKMNGQDGARIQHPVQQPQANAGQPGGGAKDPAPAVEPLDQNQQANDGQPGGGAKAEPPAPQPPVEDQPQDEAEMSGKEIFRQMHDARQHRSSFVDVKLFAGADGTKTYRELWHAYQDSTRDLRSRGFVSDIITDIGGPTIARFQAVAWTIGLAIMYVHATYHDIQAPVFPAALLTLMGISSGVYLGFKIPETQPATK